MSYGIFLISNLFCFKFITREQFVFYPVTGRNEHACMLLIYLLVKLYELQER